MAWEPRLWETPLGRFVHEFGAGELAARLDYTRSAVYHWVQGSVRPYPDTAREIVKIAREAKFKFDDGGPTRRSVAKRKHVVVFTTDDLKKAVRRADREERSA